LESKWVQSLETQHKWSSSVLLLHGQFIFLVKKLSNLEEKNKQKSLLKKEIIWK